MRDDVPPLRLVPVVREIERSFAAGCARRGFRLVHYSLQDTHAHLIVEARDRGALGRAMKAIGGRLARAVNRVTGHRGRVLADRYYLQLLSTPRHVRNALRYVLLNARHHAKKARVAMTKAFRIDPASSGRWFDGWTRWPRAEGAAPASSGLPFRPVARPRTWLLAVGWRRHGLVDPADVPG